MKGVIVEVGEPKSIVLYNNGKIGSIPTTAGCRIGTVVTVELNNRFKNMVVILAAVLLVGIGVCIGVLGRGKPAVPYNGRIPPLIAEQPLTVEQVKNFPEDTPVALTGTIIRFLGDEKYIFGDATGEITVDIDKKAGRGFSAGDTVAITGKVEHKKQGVIIDIKTITRLSAP